MTSGSLERVWRCRWIRSRESGVCVASRPETLGRHRWRSDDVRPCDPRRETWRWLAHEDGCRALRKTGRSLAGKPFPDRSIDYRRAAVRSTQSRTVVAVDAMLYDIKWIIPRLRNPSHLWNIASSITFAAVGIFSKIIIGKDRPCFAGRRAIRDNHDDRSIRASRSSPGTHGELSDMVMVRARAECHFRIVSRSYTRVSSSSSSSSLHTLVVLLGRHT